MVRVPSAREFSSLFCAAITYSNKAGYQIGAAAHVYTTPWLAGSDGQETAFRMFCVVGVILLLVVQRDEETEP